MKTRTGFVSNSSSSSFVIITTKEAWEAAKKKYTEQVGENVAKVVIGEYGRGSKAKILGKDALVFTGVMSTEEFGLDAINSLQNSGKLTEEEAEELSETAYEHIGELEDILNKDGISYCGGNN